MILVDIANDINTSANLRDVNKDPLCKGIYVSASGTVTGSILLQVSADNINFFPLKDSSNNQVVLTPNAQGILLRTENVFIKCDLSSATSTDLKVIAQ